MRRKQLVDELKRLWTEYEINTFEMPNYFYWVTPRNLIFRTPAIGDGEDAPKSSKETAEIFLELLDLDGSGGITLDEFLKVNF